MAERRDYEQFYKELDQKKLDFNEALSAFANTLVPGMVGTLVRGMALRVVNGVTAKTPVDTGRARANWNIAIGTSPDLSVTDDTHRNPNTEVYNVLKNLEPFDAVTVSNNVVYIGSLERGHSQQAPVGMLGLTLDELRVTLEAGKI